MRICKAVKRPDSERPIIIGNEEALSTALFDDCIDYVALGHFT